MKISRSFPTTTARDLFFLVAGERLGRGMNREVFANKLDPTSVVKFETEGDMFQNVSDYHVWMEIEHMKIAEWFAPVLGISSNGIVLVQKRTRPVSFEEFPDEIPSFFRDIKLANFGWLDGKVVCHDFGTGLHRTIRYGTRKVKKDAKERTVL